MLRKMFVLFTLLATVLGPSAASALAKGGPAPQPSGQPQSLDAALLPQDSPWNFTTIHAMTGQDLGKHAALAFAPDNNQPYISYYDASNKDLMLANPVKSGGNCGPDNGWYCRTIDATGDVGSYSSIDIYPGIFGNVIGISYYDATNKALKYAEFFCVLAPCSWNIATVQDPGIFLGPTYGSFSSMKFDSQGKAHIAYYGTSTTHSGARGWLAYAHQVDSGGNCGRDAAEGKWQCDQVDADNLNPSSGQQVGSYPSLDLNGSDEPRIAYYDSSNKVLKYARGGASAGNCGVSGDWQCDVIDDSADVGIGASLHIDKGASDSPLIAYYDKTNGKLRYASIPSSGANCGPDFITPGTKIWRCVDIDTIGAGLIKAPGISIAASGDGSNIYIAYQDASDDLAPATLKVAHPEILGNCGPKALTFFTWECSTVDDASYGSGYLSEADYVSVAVNQSGMAGIAYYESDSYYNEGHLKFAYQYSQLFLPMMRKK